MPNIDLTNALLFALSLFLYFTLFMTYFFAPSLLFVNFCPMHNGCGVSESGWSWDLGLVGMRGRKRKRERDMKREMERERWGASG